MSTEHAIQRLNGLLQGHSHGAAKSNRRFASGGGSYRVRAYGQNVLRRSGQWMNISGLKHTRAYRVAERVGVLKELGRVKVVFSRRRGDRHPIVLATNDLSRPARKVVADCSRRWSIELLIKEEKQHLGLAAYRVLRYRAVVTHLPACASHADRHLVDAAYACLTHLGIKAHGAQGHHKNNRVLWLPPIRRLKTDLQRVVWNEAIKDVVKVRHERPVLRRLEKLLAA